MGFINFILGNWVVIAVAIAFISVGIMSIRKMFALSLEKQIERIIQWFFWAVVEAEKSLGSGTGALKLSFVYGQFAIAFPWLARVVSVCQQR